jgi:dienelactone hydrolase
MRFVPLGALLVSTTLMGWAPVARALLEEQVVQIPVRTGTKTHDTRRGAVLIVREVGTGRRPFIVVQHGRPADEDGRRRLGLQSYPANARYFASLGFVVLIPTRIGYGVTGGPDVESTGECADKQYGPGVAAGVAQTRDVAAFAAKLPYVDPSRGLIIGESFGGLIAVATASSDIPGVLGAVNIEGGDGGDVTARPDHPCQPERLRELLATLGSQARLPSLWMYSANDRLWGPDLPKSWYAAYRAAGGRARFVPLPADKNNGHYIFNRNPPAWQPAVALFLKQLGLDPLAR